MANDFRVQRGEVVFGADENNLTVTLPTTLMAISRAFVRLSSVRTTGRGLASAFPNGSLDSNEFGARVKIFSTTKLQFERWSDSPDVDLVCRWELVEYIGPAGGKNEFVNRLQAELLIFNPGVLKITGTVSGDFTRCVPFLHSIDSRDAGQHWDREAHTTEVIDLGGGNYRVDLRRSIDGSQSWMRCSLVEFTGSAWTVQNNQMHAFAAAGVDEEEPITDVGDWLRALIEGSYRASGGDSEVDSTSHLVRPGATTDKLRWRLEAGAEQPSRHHAIAHVAENPALRVQHIDNLAGAAIGASGESFDVAIPTPVDDVSNTMVRVLAITAEAAADYPTGFFDWELVDTETVRLRQKRDGAGSRYALQVIQLPLPTLELTPDPVAIRLLATTPNVTRNLRPGPVTFRFRTTVPQLSRSLGPPPVVIRLRVLEPVVDHGQKLDIFRLECDVRFSLSEAFDVEF